MRRIAGIVHLDRSRVAAERLARMARLLSFPGSQMPEIYLDRNAGLVSIGSESNPWASMSPHPLQGIEGGPAVVLDGRIDNRDELLAALKAELGPSSPSPTNEQLLRAAYEKWGDRFPERLVGDFAVAIWDAANRIMLCTRDHFGVKPLYYHVSARSFAFASTAEAVLAAGIVPITINEGRIADLLIEPWPSLDCIDKTSSFYEGVFRLEPAHTIVVRDRDSETRRYWKPSPVLFPPAASDADRVESFRVLLKEAVTCRLPNAGPPASMLSGGLDSASIVATARQALTQDSRGPLHTFSGVYGHSRPGGDPEHIAAIVNQGGLEAHLISELELKPQVDELVAKLAMEPEPFDWLTNLDRTSYLMASGFGVRSVMDGVDGDSLILRPYSVRGWLLRRGAFRTALEETLGAGGVEAWATPPWALLLESLRLAFVPDWLKSLRRKGRYRSAGAWAIRDTIISPDLAARVRVGDRWAVLDAQVAPLGNLRPEEAHAQALDHPGIAVRLELTQRTAGAFGIEVVHPLLDVRLAEFCLALPWQLQTRHGWTKLILREAVGGLLPPQVVWRNTRDALGRDFNMLVFRERASQFRELVMDEGHALSPYVDMPKLHEVWRQYSADGEFRYESQIWHAIALAFWLRLQRSLFGSAP